MRDIDACGLSYVRNGDITDCRLVFNHEHDCEDANRAAFVSSLRQRAWWAANEAWL